MKFFFPDSQDFVDPSFDFERESRSPDRVRHRDDLYAHEVFSSTVYDGLLVSKGIVDGYGNGSSRYTMAQRHRLLRVGAPEFFRTDPRNLPIMGDCGAFTYVREAVPPYTVDEVMQFYVECAFDFGISVDHVILAYQPKFDEAPDAVPSDFRLRLEITLQLASEFLARHRAIKPEFEPVGVAQGWSPLSYARAVQALQQMGYTYIALGGMVPLKTKEIISCLVAIADVRKPETKLHLLGVTRTDHLEAFARYGVASFDSTSPLRRAFKDDKDNYYTLDRTYTAVRVPQVEGNPQLQKRIKSGQVSQDRARQLEKSCLASLKKFAAGECPLEQALEAVVAYDNFCQPERDMREVYREVLTDRPWSHCHCDVCRSIGYHVILFRGAERNRRRGLHNVWVFYRRLQRELEVLGEDRAGSKVVTV
ncbi:MAG: hypothetical protein HONDAALG_03916 [Gammaproteobacteria bacterium]|nr:hypothetical protein [Gammaproteobacteria bacterium]